MEAKDLKKGFWLTNSGVIYLYYDPPEVLTSELCLYAKSKKQKLPFMSAWEKVASTVTGPATGFSE